LKPALAVFKPNPEANADKEIFFKAEIEANTQAMLKENKSGSVLANLGGPFTIVEFGTAKKTKKEFPDFVKEEKKEEEKDAKKPREFKRLQGLMKKNRQKGFDRYRKCLERSQQIRSYS